MTHHIPPHMTDQNHQSQPSKTVGGPGEVEDTTCEMEGTAGKVESTQNLLDPVAPGEILYEEFMEPLGITKYRLAKSIHVSATRIGEIIAGKRKITADTDLRLCRYFGLSEGYWQRLQVLYDTRVARQKLQDELDAIEPLKTAECALMPDTQGHLATTFEPAFR